MTKQERLAIAKEAYALLVANPTWEKLDLIAALDLEINEWRGNDEINKQIWRFNYRTGRKGGYKILTA